MGDTVIRTLVIEGSGTSWMVTKPFYTGITCGPIRLERSSPGRPGRIVIEAPDTVLEDLQPLLALPLVEAPPIHDIEYRLCRLESFTRIDEG
jgi:hypothetical protein